MYGRTSSSDHRGPGAHPHLALEKEHQQTGDGGRWRWGKEAGAEEERGEEREGKRGMGGGRELGTGQLGVLQGGGRSG